MRIEGPPNPRSSVEDNPESVRAFLPDLRQAAKKDGRCLFCNTLRPPACLRHADRASLAPPRSVTASSVSPPGLLKFLPQKKADRAEPSSVAKRNPFAAIAHGHDLAEAIVDAIREPLLVLDPDLRVIAASRSFYRTFAVTPKKTEGKLVFELGDGHWNIPGLRVLLEDIIPKRRTVEAYEVEHKFPSIGRRVMLLNARRVFDEEGSA